MALTVEDGTGLASADAYASLTEVNSYWTDHGSPTTWTGASDAAKESAIRYATRWIGQFVFVGEIVRATQALSWPRLGASDHEGRSIASNVVPSAVKDAVSELALAHVEGNAINATLTRDDYISSVKAETVSVQFSKSAPSVPVHQYVRDLLAPIVLGTHSGRLRRG